MIYEVIVGNVGSVYRGTSSRVAWEKFLHYVEHGEEVTIFQGGELMKEYIPHKKGLTKKHYADAIAVQDACNLSGVAFSFAEAMKALCDEGLDTAQKNRHPIAVLYASKIASLTGCEDQETFSQAFKTATDNM